LRISRPASACSEYRNAAALVAVSSAISRSQGFVSISTKSSRPSRMRCMGKTTWARGDRISLNSSSILSPRSSSSPATRRMVAGRAASRSISMGSSRSGLKPSSSGVSPPLHNIRAKPPASGHEPADSSIRESLPKSPPCNTLTAMPGPQELLLIRHGQSTANASGVWQGQMEFPLSEEGRRQARSVGKALAGERFDAIYSSPLGRALETAEIIVQETGFPGDIIPIVGLTERRGGSLERTTHAERVARNPELVKKLLELPEEERWALVGAETGEEI